MPSSAYTYDDRRNNYKYPRSQHSSSSSSYVSSSFNHPSPSSSATSTSSSVRTPPDLLLNGATLANNLSNSAKGAAILSSKQPIQSVQKSQSAAGYQTKKQERVIEKQARYMTIAQLEDRLKILSKVTASPIVKPDLPSPPSSAGLKGKEKIREAAASQHRTSLSQKRKAEDRASESPEAQRPRRMSRTMNESSSSSLSSFEPLSLPRVREWSKERFIDTAAAYRHRGRELKHRGDRRLRDSSTNYSSPISEALIAGLEQTDALLLYVYGFWCDDQGRGTCITENWNSLFGLLKYVYLRHEKNKATVLAGLCRLLESSVLRHIAGHEMRMLTHRIGKASSSIDPTSKEEMHELSVLMQKVVGDQERSNRLHVQARQTVLNLTILHQHCPSLARFCEKSMQSPLWASSDQAQLATRLDPCSNSIIESDLAASSTNGWCWPLDVSSPFPMLVCFGRAVLREIAKEARISFHTESVAL